MNNTEQLIIEHLKFRYPYPTTRWELCQITGCCDSAVRNIIHGLRRRGVWIVSTSKRAGYTLTANPDTWNEFCDRQRHQMLGGLYPKSNEDPRQISFVLTVKKDGI